MHRLYVAAPLFSEAELAFNREIRNLLANYFQVYLPQEDGGLMVDMIKKGESPESARRRVFSQDIAAIKETDYVLIILDGRSVDEGACFELGFGYALGKKCVGYQSDPRRLLTVGNNPMLESALDTILTSRLELDQWAASQVSARPVSARIAKARSAGISFAH